MRFLPTETFHRKIKRIDLNHLPEKNNTVKTNNTKTNNLKTNNLKTNNLTKNVSIENKKVNNIQTKKNEEKSFTIKFDNDERIQTSRRFNY